MFKYFLLSLLSKVNFILFVNDFYMKMRKRNKKKLTLFLLKYKVTQIIFYLTNKLNGMTGI